MLAYRSPVIGATAGLLLFYWFLSSAYWFWSTGGAFAGYHIDQSVRAALTMLAGCGVGLLGGLTFVLARRWKLMLNLEGDSFNGVKITTGAMPMKASVARDDKLEALDAMRLPRGIALWHAKWLASAVKHPVKGQNRGAAYASLAKAILEVLHAHRDIPAGIAPPPKAVSSDTWGPEDDAHDEAAPAATTPPPAAPHGGHTLLEHSYSVAYTALAIAKTWTYEAAIQQWNRSEKARGTFRKIGKKNGAYQFNPNDELVPILGLAHDLGKIHTFKRKSAGWVVTREDHDSISAQILMRIPEFWRIPRRERRIALLVVSTYHRDGELQRHKEHVGYEDRIFALLQLLILADRQTGALEAGITASALAQGDDDEDEEVDWKPKVWAAFAQLLNEANRISPKHNAYRIGQKNVLEKGVPMIVLNEMSVRKELERVLPRECVRYAQTRFGSDINGLTALLLESIDGKGALIKQTPSYSVAPTSAVWHVEFFGKDKDRSEPIARWKYSILVDPRKHFPRLCEAPNADTTPKIVGPTGNRNEHILVGVDGPEAGVEIEPEFGTDDGNRPLDDDELPPDPRDGSSQDAQTTVFTDSMMNSAFPEPSEEMTAIIENQRPLRGAKRSKLRPTRAVKSPDFIEEVPAPPPPPETLEVRFSRAMRKLHVEAADGKIMGAILREQAWLIPILQATKTEPGKILLEGDVGERLAVGSLAGVAIHHENGEVFLQVRMEPTAQPTPAGNPQASDTA